MESDNNKSKADKIILKQNDKIINKIVNTKQKRHVKEPTEPIFKDILNSFSFNYGKLVVSRTSIEILKLVKDEF